MTSIDLQTISIYNKWTLDLTKKIQFEYERFLILKNSNSNLSPSNLIDMFWHTHILDTKSYLQYCQDKFKKIIHHNPADSFDQKLRSIRLANTLVSYKELFGNYVYPEIWLSDLKKENSKINNTNSNLPNPPNPSNKTTSINLEKEQLILPLYKDNIVSDLDIIKIFVFYSFDSGYSKPKEFLDGTWNFKKWKPNNNPLDRKILTYKITNKNITMEDLKIMISQKTGHPDYAIVIKPHPTYKKILDAYEKIKYDNSKTSSIKINSCINTLADNYLGMPNFYDSKKNLIFTPDNKAFKFFIAELVEITSNGFC
jgi:hypothetical protein